MTMTVGKKLLAMSLIGAFLTVAVAVTGWMGISTVSGATSKMMKEEAQIAQHSARVRANTLAVRRFEKDIFINIKDAKKVDEYVKKLSEQQDHLAARLDALKAVAVLPQDRERVAQMAADLKVYVAGMSGIITKVRAGQITTAEDGNKAVNEDKDAIHRLEKNAEEFAAEGNKRMDDIAHVLEAKAASAMWMMSSLAALAVVLGLVLSTLTGWNITSPLSRTVEVLRAVAARDFTQRLDVTRRDELGQMADAVNEAVDGMRTALQEVSIAAGHAASASQQLSAASEQLSSGAQEQASSLEETAASLEEITGTVKQNADNARQASQLAVGSRGVAEKGGQVVADAVQSMGEINKSSKKIADIITTIDEIAFQTNLLALNAAVEAARAGEQGRGFAVVASEVRNLAQRSATAAKEIKALIQDSVQKVEAGSELVNKSGETLSEIVGSVKRVTDIVGEIAAASQEQTTGIDQVNKAVTQMDQVTQSNAAQTEELSSTAQSLAAQAEQLQALVARFKLGDAAGARPAAGHGAVGARPAPKSKGLMKSVAARIKPKQAEPALVAAHAQAPNGNGSAHAKDDGFEEF